MPIDLASLRPGTVIVTATVDKGGWWIRLRSKLMGQVDLHNHVAVFTHLDDTGRPRGLEGRPAGFGWANLTRYLDRPDTVTNAAQPLTDDQRTRIVAGAVQMVGIPYDWASILAFALGTARLPFLAREWPDDGLPSHVVCSSAVDFLYEGVGAPNPGGYGHTRRTDPDDWSAWILRSGWAG